MRRHAIHQNIRVTAHLLPPECQQQRLKVVCSLTFSLVTVNEAQRGRKIFPPETSPFYLLVYAVFDAASFKKHPKTLFLSNKLHLFHKIFVLQNNDNVAHDDYNFQIFFSHFRIIVVHQK